MRRLHLLSRSAAALAGWAVFLATAVVLFGFAGVAAAPSGTIKVGLSIPLSGPVAWMGQDYRKGAILAAELINARGGVLGKKIELFEADDACTPAQAASAYRKLIDFDRVDVIIGAGCSGPTLAAMPIVEQSRVANLTPASTNPDITRRAGVGGNRWQFRLNVDDSLMAASFSKYVAKRVKSVTIFAANNDFGRGAAQVYQQEFRNLGVRVAGVEYFEQGQADYRPTLTKVKGQNPEALLLVMEAKDAAVFVRQFHELGMTQRIFARGSVVTAEFISAMGQDVHLGEGIEEATLWALGQDPELDRLHQERWGEPPHAHGAMAYYAVLTLARAIESYGKTDRAGIRDALAQVRVELPGLGFVEFDDHNQAHPNMVITRLSDGKVELLQVLPTR